MDTPTAESPISWASAFFRCSLTFSKWANPSLMFSSSFACTWFPISIRRRSTFSRIASRDKAVLCPNSPSLFIMASVAAVPALADSSRPALSSASTLSRISPRFRESLSCITVRASASLSDTPSRTPAEDAAILSESSEDTFLNVSAVSERPWLKSS